MSRPHGIVTLVLTLTTLSLAAPSSARDTHDGLGSAILPEFSLRHAPLEAGDEATLLLCVTNQNPHSRRLLETGDAFRLEMGDGSIGGCDTPTTFSRSLPLDPADLSCSWTEDTATLRWEGSPVRWGVGDSLCAEVRWTAGLATSTALTSYEVGNAGAYAPARPAALLVPVSEALARRDGGGIGARVMVTSTEMLQLHPRLGGLPIPGLEAEMNVREGSRLLVFLNVVGWRRDCPEGLRSGTGNPVEPASVEIELDGAVVAAQRTDPLGGGDASATISWLSGALPEGAHQVRALLHPTGPGRLTGDTTLCFGSDEEDERDARLVVLELLEE